MKNIRLNCTPKSKEEVIREVGGMLVDSGYVKPGYVDGMVKREESFSTNVGNEIALPHGIEAVKDQIISSGIAVMVFPEGTEWSDGEKVKLVIGIAGVDGEHLEILANIAERLSLPEDVAKLIQGTEKDVYEMLTRKADEN